MPFSVRRSLASLGTLIILVAGCASDDSALHEASSIAAPSVGLLESMSWMQTYTHKLILSAEAENRRLVDFYLHEIEELAEDVLAGVPEYDGFPIGSLVESMLITEIDRLEEVVDQGDWEAIREGVSRLVASCNSCHAATDHEYIRITERSAGNPFLQEFGVTE